MFHDVARSLPNAPLTLDAPAGATVQADRVLLADLLRNLAVNALHASTPGNTVRLICTDAGNGWRLAVIDTGCGIPAEAVPHLTEPFYRVDKARARAEDRAQADANAAKFGRSKAEKDLEKARTEKAARDLEAHRRDEDEDGA